MFNIKNKKNKKNKKKLIYYKLKMYKNIFLIINKKHLQWRN